jgi:hypothetical protein
MQIIMPSLESYHTHFQHAVHTKIPMLDKCRASSTAIATGYGLGFDSQQGRDSSLLHKSRSALGLVELCIQ